MDIYNPCPICGVAPWIYVGRPLLDDDSGDREEYLRASARCKRSKECPAVLVVAIPWHELKFKEGQEKEAMEALAELWNKRTLPPNTVLLKIPELENERGECNYCCPVRIYSHSEDYCQLDWHIPEDKNNRLYPGPDCPRSKDF